MDIIELAERLSKINPERLLKRILRDSSVQALIINLNTENQLKELNEDSTGIKLSDIGEPYSPYTQLVKGLGKFQVNLFDTGEYYESFQVIPLANGDFEITSNPQKEDGNLEDRYGDKIEGLNEKNKKVVNIRLEEEAIRIILR